MRSSSLVAGALCFVLFACSKKVEKPAVPAPPDNVRPEPGAGGEKVAEPPAEVQRNNIREERSTEGDSEVRCTVYTDKDGKTVRHGPYSRWSASGKKISEGNYRDGKLHGTYTSWHDTGQKQYETEYEDGEYHGVSRSWEESGRPFSEKRYVHNQLVSDKSWRDGKWIDNPIPRSLCTYSMALSLRTQVQCTLYLVRSGSVERICSHGMSRSPNFEYPGDEMNKPQPHEVTVMMTEETKNELTMYSLESKGSTRSGTSHTLKSHKDFKRDNSKVLISGELAKLVPEKTTKLLYVEGDRPFTATIDMTPEEFAKSNPGNYLIVTIRWENP